MAKARNITPVRDRAIAAWYKAKSDIYPSSHPVFVNKSRKRSTVTVSNRSGGDSLTWSYKGGFLRKIGA
jgi:hypothetical protein